MIFVLLGLTAVGLTQSLRQNQDTLDKIAGVLIIAMGVLFVARLFVVRLNKEWRVDALLERAGSGGPMVAGAAFAIAWTPCIGPTLAAILTLAGSTGSVGPGGLMLAVFSARPRRPLATTAIAFARMTTAFGFIRRHYPAIMATGGVVLIAMGVSSSPAARPPPRRRGPAGTGRPRWTSSSRLVLRPDAPLRVRFGRVAGDFGGRIGRAY